MKFCHLISILILLLSVVAYPGSSNKNHETELDPLVDSLFNNLPANTIGSRITVVPFTETATQGKGYGESIAELLIVAIQQLGLFTLVDRSEFQRAVNEIALSQTGIIEDSATIKIGKMLSSQYILSGSISMLFGKYRVTAKIINTETTEIVKSAFININAANLENFSKELLGEQGKVSSSVFRSLLVPGWGQFYTNHNVRGALNLSACLGALGATGYFTYQTNKYKSKKDNHIHEQSVDSIMKNMTREQIIQHDSITLSYYRKYNRNFDYMLISAFTLGALWTLNLTDATIAGIQSKKKFQLYFSGNISDKSFQSGIVLRF